MRPPVLSHELRVPANDEAQAPGLAPQDCGGDAAPTSQSRQRIAPAGADRHLGRSGPRPAPHATSKPLARRCVAPPVRRAHHLRRIDTAPPNAPTHELLQLDSSEPIACGANGRLLNHCRALHRCRSSRWHATMTACARRRCQAWSVGTANRALDFAQSVGHHAALPTSFAART